MTYTQPNRALNHAAARIAAATSRRTPGQISSRTTGACAGSLCTTAAHGHTAGAVMMVQANSLPRA